MQVFSLTDKMKSDSEESEDIFNVDYFNVEVFPNNIYLYWEGKEKLNNKFYIYVSDCQNPDENNFKECRIVENDNNGHLFENVFSFDYVYINIYYEEKLLKEFEIRKIS